MTTYIAFDIEKAGCGLIGHPIFSIGICVGDADGNVLQKKRINLRIGWPLVDDNGRIKNYGSFEPRCWDQFWSKQPKDLVEQLKSGAVDQHEGFASFSRFLDTFEDNAEVVFLSDNPSFDIATLDANLERYSNRMPLRYSASWAYRTVVDTDSVMDLLPKRELAKITEKFVDPFVVHDHDPANDAEYIYRSYVAVRSHFTKN